MRKVILFGSTGNLGQMIAKELAGREFDLTVVVRNEEKAKFLSHITAKSVVANVCNPKEIENICDNQDVVISALGKSVSPNDKSKPGFADVDLKANSYILGEAKRSGIKKFVYVSAFHCEKYLHLEYFRVHHEFSELLKKSGIDYSIIKPPAIFSAFIDVIKLAKKGQLVNIGTGEKRTNPIYEGDLAKICVNSIWQENSIIEAGGKTIFTRKQLNQIIQHEVNPNKKLRTVPLGLFKIALPMIKLFDKNSYDKFAFFAEILRHDTIAPQIGETEFEPYIKDKAALL
jgi:uncharacterized protein YbjT (DUF2867 family)